MLGQGFTTSLLDQVQNPLKVSTGFGQKPKGALDYLKQQWLYFSH